MNDFFSEFDIVNDEEIFFDDADEMNSQSAMDLIELELDHEEL